MNSEWVLPNPHESSVLSHRIFRATIRLQRLQLRLRNTASANRFFVPQSLQVGIPLCGLSFAHVLTLQSYGPLAWSHRLRKLESSIQSSHPAGKPKHHLQRTPTLVELHPNHPKIPAVIFVCSSSQPVLSGIADPVADDFTKFLTQPPLFIFVKTISSHLFVRSFGCNPRISDQAIHFLWMISGFFVGKITPL